MSKNNFSLLDNALEKSASNKAVETVKESTQRLVSQMPKERLKTREEYEAAGRIIAEAKVARKNWTEFMEPIKKATRAAHKVACDQFNEIDRVLDDVVTHTTPFLADYEDWHSRYNAQKEAEANEKAQNVSNYGFDPFIVTLPNLVAPEGLSKRVEWRADVVDFMELVKAVAEGRAPLAYLEPNQKLLNMQARALKDELKDRIPGVKPVQEASYALRGDATA